MKGIQVMIPGVMREKILEHMHEEHLGMTNSKRRGRDVVFDLG